MSMHIDIHKIIETDYTNIFDTLKEIMYSRVWDKLSSFIEKSNYIVRAYENPEIEIVSKRSLYDFFDSEKIIISILWVENKFYANIFSVKDSKMDYSAYYNNREDCEHAAFIIASRMLNITT